MSSSFSDNTDSQLDSDMNFLPTYIMEIEDDAVQPPTAEHKAMTTSVSEVLPIESIYYILLVYGYLGKRRIPLPACAYHAIRQACGGKDVKGFEDDEELE
ncbi:Hypothetical predicted protein [Paramuricea clavata]|uniref:Uncharacterized protein n=1 Tax=Paramuricea clavata TaxID=317549 RepID=A0A6S7JYB1_PARCT|nr:Hypothetical predicted protein [Paramuricea clavata]